MSLKVKSCTKEGAMFVIINTKMQCNEIDFKVIVAKMLMGLKARQDGFKLAKVLIRIIFFFVFGLMLAFFFFGTIS